MIFGDDVRAPATASAAEWLADACRGDVFTVGWFVPNDYPAYVRVLAPEPTTDDWWASYRRVVAHLVEIGRRHTSTPERAWFAIWEGHGWATTTTHIAVREPLGESAQQAVDAERARLRTEDAHRSATIRTALDGVPTFDLPDRRYHLVTGPVSAATGLREPDSPERWQRPDLFWPDDRAWFVATDVDVWSFYVGGTADFVAELIERSPVPTEPVTLQQLLEPED